MQAYFVLAKYFYSTNEKANRETQLSANRDPNRIWFSSSRKNKSRDFKIRTTVIPLSITPHCNLQTKTTLKFNGVKIKTACKRRLFNLILVQIFLLIVSPYFIDFKAQVCVFCNFILSYGCVFISQ